MKRMITLIGATAPLAILAAVGAAPNAYAQATVPCVQNAGADGILGTPDDPENTLECGLGAEASAPGATAYGSGAKATANEAMAVGFIAAAEETRSTAIGTGSSATADQSVALGWGSVADRGATVSVGNAGLQRQITNVAAGTLVSDAVNVGQLNTAMGAAALTAIANSAVRRGTSGDSSLQSDGSTASGNGAVALGQGQTATGNGAVAIGDGAVALGNASNAFGLSAIAIGNNANALADGSIAIGRDTIRQWRLFGRLGREQSDHGPRGDGTGCERESLGCRLGCDRLQLGCR